MRSLRRRLLISLWGSVGAIAVISAGVAYIKINSQARALLDDQLQQVAKIVALQTARAPAASPEDSDIEVAIWDGAGTLQYASSPRMRSMLGASSGLSDTLIGNEPYRLYTYVSDGRHIEVAQPIDVRDDQAEAAALAALLPLLVLMPVLGVVIALVLRTLLKPIKEVAAVVSRRNTFADEALASQGLPKEILPLVEEINRLLARQRAAALRERTFIEDAAHALKTPLAALQLQADVLDGSTDPHERSNRLEDLRAGIRRAVHLSEQLLSLARSESSSEAFAQEADVDGALRQVHGIYEPAASASGVTLTLKACSGSTIRGESRDLMLIVSNLLDNALRYGRPGSQVEVAVECDDRMVCIEVRDEGKGIPPEQLTRVFERFARVPGDASTGSGLGLATVRTLATKLGGSVALHNRSDGRNGVIARVMLPYIQVR